MPPTLFAAPVPRGALACLLAFALLLGGCAQLRSARLLAPAWFGMISDGPDLFVEASSDAAQRQALRAELATARQRMVDFWGEPRSRPLIVACHSEPCARAFGHQGARADAFGDTVIRLSPRGLTAAMIAHEWSHAELYRRLGGAAGIGAVPRWFDEGLAVVVSQEPTHDANAWRQIRDRPMPVPALTELTTREDWISALRRYGETDTTDPNRPRIVYARAGHAVRTWLGTDGPARTNTLILALREGEGFDGAWRRLAADSAHADPR